MRRTGMILIALLIAGLFPQANAHHSTANFNFDEDARITIEGTVTYFSFTNPHSFIKVEVHEDDGSTSEYTIFLTSRVVLQRNGWRPGMIKPGDVVEIEGSPDRRKDHELYLQRIVFPDGSEWRRDSIPL